jgi:hypothetical protein
MWPFSKGRNFPEVKQNSDGTINFSLTEDEAREVDLALQMFKDLLVHPDVAEKLRNGTIAVALSRYAKELVATSSSESLPLTREPLEKAVAAVWKSYSLYPSPIFLYHRACFLQMLGSLDEARQLFALFLKKHAEFEMDLVDRPLMENEGSVIDHALSHARSLTKPKSTSEHATDTVKDWLKTCGTPKISPFREHSANIFRKANEGAEEIRQLSEDKSVEQRKYGLSQTEWVMVFCEFLNFYLHLTDRFVCGHLNEAKRGEVMTELEELTIDASVRAIHKGLPADVIGKIRREWWANLLQSMQEYSQYKKLFPEGGGHVVGTLFYEFGQRIATLSGHDMDIGYVMLASRVAADSLRTLGMNEFVDKVR